MARAHEAAEILGMPRLVDNGKARNAQLDFNGVGGWSLAKVESEAVELDGQERV